MTVVSCTHAAIRLHEPVALSRKLEFAKVETAPQLLCVSRHFTSPVIIAHSWPLQPYEYSEVFAVTKTTPYRLPDACSLVGA